ncbi:MAG: ABC transporter ATP-binding protein [Verrucomicrobiae bacterium]|nr:ABC transporter ATP-binding protein [Verrucomicrobiae bacterium]
MKIEIRALTKRFGKTCALDRVSFSLEPGQIVAVLGANGAGKTTLLNCLAGLLAPTEGAVYFDDMPFNRGRLDLRRKLHFLPDFPLLCDHWTIIQHLATVLRIYEADTPGVENVVLELFRKLDLLPLAEKPLGYLSRGQRYKTALAALLAVNPELWLLDEPFASGMDPHGLQIFKEEARQAARHGRVIIFTTQILDVVERFADRVCVLHEGEVRALEKVSQLQATGPGTEALAALFQQLREQP